MTSPDPSDMPDYQWQVQWWDPAAAKWSVYGPEDAATGVAFRYDGTPQALAETLLGNWSDGIDEGGRWRATVWAYDPARPRGEPVATAEITRPATVTGQDGALHGLDETVRGLVDGSGSPFMTGHDSARAVQLADLAESVAGNLDRLVATVPLPGEDPAVLPALAAAVVVRKLESALDHIARTISSPAVRAALPHAARQLDVAASGIGTSAHIIRSAEPAIKAGRGPSTNFPDPALPVIPDDLYLHGTALETASFPRDFPRPVAPGTAARPGAPPRATGQASPPPTRATGQASPPPTRRAP